MDPCERELLIPAPHQAVALESRDVRALHSHSAGVYRSQVRGRQLRAGEPEFYEPRFNVAPTQRTVVIPTRDMQREARRMRWGLIPSWAKDASIGARLVKARAQDIDTGPSFRPAFKYRRCLIPGGRMNVMYSAVVL